MSRHEHDSPFTIFLGINVLRGREIEVWHRTEFRVG